MGHIAMMNPCGLDDTEMTNLAAEAGKPVTVTEVAEAFVRQFGRVLACETTLVGEAASAAG